MAPGDITSTELTNMHNINSSKTSATTFLWEVTPVNTDGATGQKEYEWQSTDWTKNNGYYNDIPLVKAAMKKIAQWTVGRTFKVKGSKEIQNRINKIKGYGKDSMRTIMKNQVRVKRYHGDSYAEIIKDKKGRLINLKPLNPGYMKHIVNDQGMLIRFEQTDGSKKVVNTFSPDRIFYLANDRNADEVHGTSDLLACEDTIKMLKESKLDMKTVFHRYVKPLIISTVGTEDENDIDTYKKKLDKAIELGENMVVPEDTLKSMEKISIPQFSTLDPLPWQKGLKKELILAFGVPEIVMGNEDDATEAAAKILYLAFEQVIRDEQEDLIEQVKLQLGLDIELEFPASIEPDSLTSLNKDNKKDGQVNKSMNVNPTKTE